MNILGYQQLSLLIEPFGITGCEKFLEELLVLQRRIGTSMGERNRKEVKMLGNENTKSGFLQGLFICRTSELNPLFEK